MIKLNTKLAFLKHQLTYFCHPVEDKSYPIIASNLILHRSPTNRIASLIELSFYNKHRES